MTDDDALSALDSLLKPHTLNDLQELVFRQSWAGRSYAEMADTSSYDENYLKDVGSRLWKLMSQSLGTKVTKNNLQSILRRSLVPIPKIVVQTPKASACRVDWGEAMEVSTFYGRELELQQLHDWALQEPVRLITVVGMGGMGKSLLAIRFIDQVLTKNEFDAVVWRSLRNAPPLNTLLVDLIQFLSNQQKTQTSLPNESTALMRHLIDGLRQSRCLVVLDNVETILEDLHYGELLRQLGEARHQSCVLLTSREKPTEVAILEGNSSPVRSLSLRGLNSSEAQTLFQQRSRFSGSDSDWETVIHQYAGNPLALKIVACAIEELFNSDLAQFVEFLQAQTLIFDDIRNLLDRQFEHLSDLEQEVMFWLAINREFASFAELQADLISTHAKRRLPDTLKSLVRRSLIEAQSMQFTQQPVIMEYVIGKLIDRIVNELNTGEFATLKQYALLKTTVKDYIRESQIRVILRPISEQIRTLLGSTAQVEQQILNALATLRHATSIDYAAGNLLNLCGVLNIDLTGYDFSNLTLQHADLRGINLHHVNFQNSRLLNTTFTQTFGVVLSIAFSPDGTLLAAGDAQGDIYLWKVSESQPFLKLRGHTNRTWSIAFDPTGQWLVSGNEDQTIRVWNLQTGQQYKTLQVENTWIRTVAFSPTGEFFASGHSDRTIRLWNLQTGKIFKELQGHDGSILSLSFHPSDPILASSSQDGLIQVWNVQTGKILQTLRSHTGSVYSVAFSPNGQVLASGGSDRTIKIWDIVSSTLIQTLEGHRDAVFSIIWHPNGQLIASSSRDSTLRLWDNQTGELLAVMNPDGQYWVWAVRFSPDGSKLLSGSGGATLTLWDVQSRQVLKTLQAYTYYIWAIAAGSHVICGDSEKAIQIWDQSTNQIVQTLSGHQAWVFSVAVSSSDRWIVSGSEDQTIRIWQTETGQCLRILEGHKNWVWSVVLSPDEQYLASGSEDQTIRIWETQTGSLLKTWNNQNPAYSIAWNTEFLASGSGRMVNLWSIETGEVIQQLEGHTDWVKCVAFSDDGQKIISGSVDRTIRVWNIQTARSQFILHGHTRGVQAIAVCSNTKWLASGSDDQTIRIWDLSKGKCLQVLQGHTASIRSLAWDRENRLMSGSTDGSLKRWDCKTGECLQTLRRNRPYEGMNITDTIGLTDAQKLTLRELGAIAT